MQKITKKHIESVLRTMDSTKIYELVFNVLRKKPSRLDVMTFIDENAPSKKVANKAYSIAYNHKHNNERFGYMLKNTKPMPKYAQYNRIVDFLKENIKMIGGDKENYMKRPMLGHTHLYFCSPVYGFHDYNKWCAIEIKGNEEFCNKVVELGNKYFE